MKCRRLEFKPWVRKIPLEKGMATHSSILGWRIPWTEEPGKLQSMGSQRVGFNLATHTYSVVAVVKAQAHSLQKRKRTAPSFSIQALSVTSKHFSTPSGNFCKNKYPLHI